MSVCSQDALSSHNNKQAYIFLNNVAFDDLQALVEYMYMGEVNVSQEQLPRFLAAAEALKIKGCYCSWFDMILGLQLSLLFDFLQVYQIKEQFYQTMKLLSQMNIRPGSREAKCPIHPAHKLNMTRVHLPYCRLKPLLSKMKPSTPHPR